VNSGYLSAADWEAALTSQPPSLRIGEHLIKIGKLHEAELYEALGLQHDLPVGRPDADSISPDVTRAIPADLARRLKVLPFQVVAGALYVASPELPAEPVIAEVKNFWAHDIRFQLVPPTAFKELLEEYLPPLPPTSVPGFLTGLGLLASVVAIARTWVRPPAGARAESTR
jgi:hypothetical protein